MIYISKKWRFNREFSAVECAQFPSIVHPIKVFCFHLVMGDQNVKGNVLKKDGKTSSFEKKIKPRSLDNLLVQWFSHGFKKGIIYIR